MIPMGEICFFYNAQKALPVSLGRVEFVLREGSSPIPKWVLVAPATLRTAEGKTTNWHPTIVATETPAFQNATLTIYTNQQYWLNLQYITKIRPLHKWRGLKIQEVIE